MKARDGVDDDFGRPIVSSQLHTMHNLFDMHVRLDRHNRFASKILLRCPSTKISAGGWHMHVDCSVWTIVLDAYGWRSPLFSVGLPRYMSKGNHAHLIIEIISNWRDMVAEEIVLVSWFWELRRSLLFWRENMHGTSTIICIWSVSPADLLIVNLSWTQRDGSRVDATIAITLAVQVPWPLVLVRSRESWAYATDTAIYILAI
jgi:hypothetical protein